MINIQVLKNMRRFRDGKVHMFFKSLQLNNNLL